MNSGNTRGKWRDVTSPARGLHGERHGSARGEIGGVREAAQKHGAKARGGMREHRKTRKLREYARELREHALDGEGRRRERGA